MVCKIGNYCIAHHYQRNYFYLSIHTFFEQVLCKMFGTLLGDTFTEVCASPRNSTWFARPFFPCERVGSGDKTNTVCCVAVGVASDIIIPSLF